MEVADLHGSFDIWPNLTTVRLANALRPLKAGVCAFRQPCSHSLCHTRLILTANLRAPVAVVVKKMAEQLNHQLAGAIGGAPA